MSGLKITELGNIREILSNGEKKYLGENRPDFAVGLEDDINIIFYRGYNAATNKVALIVNKWCWENIDPTTLELDGTNRISKFQEIPKIRENVFQHNGYEYVEYNVLTWLDEAILKEKDEARRLAYQERRANIVAAQEEPTVAAQEEPTVAAQEEPTVAAQEEVTYGGIFKNIAKAAGFAAVAVVLEGTSYVLGKIVD